MSEDSICTGCTGLGKVGPGVTFIRMNHVNEIKRKKVKKKKCSINHDIVCLHIKNDDDIHRHVFDDDAPEADRFAKSVCNAHAIVTKTPVCPIRRSRSSAECRKVTRSGSSQPARSSSCKMGRPEFCQAAKSSICGGQKSGSSQVVRSNSNCSRVGRSNSSCSHVGRSSSSCGQVERSSSSCSQGGRSSSSWSQVGRSNSSCSQVERSSSNCSPVGRSDSGVGRSSSSCSQVERSDQNKSGSPLVTAADSDILRTVLSGCLDDEDLQRIKVTQHEYRLLELVAIKKWQDSLQMMKSNKLHRMWRKEREDRENNKFESKPGAEVTDEKLAAVAKVQEELMAKERQDRINHKAELERKLQIAEMKRKHMEEEEKNRMIYINRSIEEQNKQRKRIMEEMYSQHLERVKHTTDTKLENSEKVVRDERNKLVSTLRLVNSAKQELAFAMKSELEKRLESWRRQVRDVQANNVLRAEAKARMEMEKRREKLARERTCQETRHQELRRMYERIIKDHQVWHKRDVLKKHKKAESMMHEREASVERAREMGFKTAELRDIIRNRPFEEIQAVVRKKNLPKLSQKVTFCEKVIPKAARIIQSCIYIQAQNPHH